MKRRIADDSKLRVATWTALGALIVILWRVYIAATLASPIGRHAIGRAFIYATCPISMTRQHALGFAFVLIANAATYALVGVIVETVRRYWRGVRSN